MGESLSRGRSWGITGRKRGLVVNLFCTLAQRGQVFDVYHRPGNVHDSHGAQEFILACIKALKQVLPWLKIEVRMDSALFSDEIKSALVGIEFTLSVPFERFVNWKKRIQDRLRW